MPISEAERPEYPKTNPPRGIPKGYFFIYEIDGVDQFADVTDYVAPLDSRVKELEQTLHEISVTADAVNYLGYEGTLARIQHLADEKLDRS